MKTNLLNTLLTDEMMSALVDGSYNDYSVDVLSVSAMDSGGVVIRYNRYRLSRSGERTCEERVAIFNQRGKFRSGIMAD